MIETLEKEINGSTYSVTQLPARRALKLQAKLAKMLSPFLAEMLIAAESTETSLSKAVQLLVSEIDDKTFDQFVMDMLPGIRKNNIELTPSMVDLEYAGNLNELFLVLKFVLEANFSDFFLEGGIFKMLIPQSQSLVNSKKD